MGLFDSILRVWAEVYGDGCFCVIEDPLGAIRSPDHPSDRSDHQEITRIPIGLTFEKQKIPVHSGMSHFNQVLIDYFVPKALRTPGSIQ